MILSTIKPESNGIVIAIVSLIINRKIASQTFHMSGLQYCNTQRTLLASLRLFGLTYMRQLLLCFRFCFLRLNFKFILFSHISIHKKMWRVAKRLHATCYKLSNQLSKLARIIATNLLTSASPYPLGRCLRNQQGRC